MMPISISDMSVLIQQLLYFNHTGNDTLKLLIFTHIAPSGKVTWLAGKSLRLSEMYRLIHLYMVLAVPAILIHCSTYELFLHTLPLQSHDPSSIHSHWPNHPISKKPVSRPRNGTCVRSHNTHEHRRDKIQDFRNRASRLGCNLGHTHEVLMSWSFHSPPPEVSTLPLTKLPSK